MTESYDYDLLCIGSGPAGQRAAVQAAKLGKRVAVVEKRRSVGGGCVETGTIPSKTLREAVISHSRNRSAPGQGRWSEKRPAADELLDRVDEVVSREAEVVEDQLLRNEVELLHGEARFQDPHAVVILSDTGSRSVSAANIVIAVGTRPVPPPGVPADGELVITSDGVTKLKRLPRSMVVVE